MDLSPSYRTAWWILLALCGVFSALCGVAFLTVVPPQRITAGDFPNLVIGLSFAALTLVVAVQNTLFRKTAPMPQQLLMQVVCIAVTAGLMLLPMVAPPGLDPRVAYGGFLVLLAGSWLTGHLMMQGADEMVREMSRKATVAGLVIFQTGLLAYAGAERLGLISGLSAWTLAGLLMISLLAGSMWEGRRHGYGQMPKREEE